MPFPCDIFVVTALQAAAVPKPRTSGLRPRDSSVPVVSAQAPAAVAPAQVVRKPATRRSMSQALQDRSEVAVSGGKARKAAVCPPSPLPDIDSCDKEDPLAATDFVADIFGYYKRMEPLLRVSPDYMSCQVRTAVVTCRFSRAHSWSCELALCLWSSLWSLSLVIRHQLPALCSKISTTRCALSSSTGCSTCTSSSR